MENAVGCNAHELGIVNLILKVSKIFGLAPVTLTSNGIRISRGWVIYSRVLVIVLNVILIGGLAIDILAGPELAIRAVSLVEGGVWVANICIVMVLASAGVCNAPWRIPCLIRMIKSTNKIQTEVGFDYERYSKPKKQRILIVLAIITVLLLLIMDFREFYMGGLNHNKEIKAMYFYTSFYVEYCIVIILEIQFIILTHIPCRGLHCINYVLQNMLKENAQEDAAFASRTCAKLHQLSKYYIDMCSMIRKINKDNGRTFLCILLMELVDLVFNSYYWITDVVYYQELILKVDHFWCIFNTIKSILLMEPINKTQSEIQQTHNLLGQLIHIFPNDMAIKVEFDKFLHHLALNITTYSPMGIFTISTSFAIATASSMASYIVLIVQLEVG